MTIQRLIQAHSNDRGQLAPSVPTPSSTVSNSAVYQHHHSLQAPVEDNGEDHHGLQLPVLHLDIGTSSRISDHNQMEEEEEDDEVEDM